MINQDESELLSAYLDKELSGDELLFVQEKLKNSAEYREELEQLQSTKNLAMALPMIAAPTDLLDFLEEKAQDYSTKNDKSFWKSLFIPGRINMWTLTGSVAAAAVLVIFVGIQRVHENGFIPLEPLLSAHAHTSSTTLFQENVFSASRFSNDLKKYAKN